MRRASAQVGPPEEAPEELVFLTQFAAPPWGAGDAEGPAQEGPGKVENPTSVWTTIGTDA